MALSRDARLFVFLLVIVATEARYYGPPKGKTLSEWKAEKAAEKQSAEWAAANEAKMPAVNKVVDMLEDLQSQVLAEGEAEAKTYNTFACWCKTTMAEKQEAIKKGKDDKASFSAAITKLTETRKELDTKIGELEGAIATAQKEMKQATTTSNAARAVYETNEADLKAALDALKGAIKELKASKTPSLLQLQTISKTIRHAVLMADALGLDTSGSALLQQGDVPVEMENYKFHSDSIIGTLEKLLAEFTTEKNKVDAANVERIKIYDMLMQDKTDIVKAKTAELDEKQKAKSQASSDIASNNQQLSTTSATLLDDMEYLAETNDISSRKAQTWDQRSQVRADELSALVAAIKIVKGTVAEKTGNSTLRFAQLGVSVRMADVVANSDADMEAIEASAEDAEGDAPLGFLQRKQISRHQADPSRAIEGRQAVVQLLKSKSQELKSTLLSSLATQVASQDSKDVFAKVKVLIQELIERLLAEAGKEANQKGWCDKSIADATQKREYASDDIGTLNAQLAELEAKKDKLIEELGVLVDEIKELKTTMSEEKKIRAEEQVENTNTVKEAEFGLAAVQEAIKILERFYATAGKASVEYSLAQGSKGPLDDMPDAGFDAGEAYTGAGGTAGGIVGMLEVIESDFVRTIKETTKAEEKAVEDHYVSMTEAGKSLAQKEMANKENLKYKDDTELKLESANEDLKAKMAVLKASIQELLELQPACVDTGMSYADRVAHREQEIEALKKASCILNAYASYGPDGLADAC